MFEIILCKQDHEVRGDNVYEIRTKHHGTRRICKRCHLARQKAYDDRRRARRLAEVSR